MPQFNLDAFLSNFKGGTRANWFYFLPTFPFGGNAEQTSYLVRSTTTPSVTYEEMIASWQGFDAKYAGRKTYEQFTVTFNTDINADVYKSYNRWSDQIRNSETGAYTLPDAYFGDQVLQLLNNIGAPIMTYTLIDAWPSLVGGAALDYQNGETLQFDVTFSYQYHKVT